MNTPLAIRLARPSDALALTDLVLRSKRSNGYDDAFMAACTEELSVTISDIEVGLYWIAARDIPLGCVCLDPKGESGQISAFFVDPDAKRQGIGQLLWQHVKREAQALGIIRLSLDADPAAVPFYNALGFEVIGETPSGSIPNRMLPLMAIELDRQPSRA